MKRVFLCVLLFSSLVYGDYGMVFLPEGENVSTLKRMRIEVLSATESGALCQLDIGDLKMLYEEGLQFQILSPSTYRMIEKEEKGIFYIMDIEYPAYSYPSGNAEITVTTAYMFDDSTRVKVSIYRETTAGWQWVTQAEDTVSGASFTTFDIEHELPSEYGAYVY
jgi:hypothetical protein